MRSPVTVFAVIYLVLGATGLPAAVITDVVRSDGHPGTPGQPDIVPGPSPDGLQVGSQAFLDRWNPPSGTRYHWEAIPDGLEGADYVITFNNDKFFAAQNVSYDVTLGQAAMLYVFVDQRYSPFPWLGDGSSGAVFDDTGLDITLNELGGTGLLRPFDVYGAVVPAGTYSLGPAWDGSAIRNFYAIAAVGVLAEIEIKPETLNLKSKGVFTAFINLPDGYDEADIDIDTVNCEGASAVRGALADDGSLVVKFNRQDLVGVPTGSAVELTVTGQLLDGTVFSGSDTIRVK